MSPLAIFWWPHSFSYPSAVYVDKQFEKKESHKLTDTWRDSKLFSETCLLNHSYAAIHQNEVTTIDLSSPQHDSYWNEEVHDTCSSSNSFPWRSSHSRHRSRQRPKASWTALHCCSYDVRPDRVYMQETKPAFLMHSHLSLLPLSLHSSNSPPSILKWFKTHYFYLAFSYLEGQVHLHLEANYPRLRFTFRCGLARVTNVIKIITFQTTDIIWQPDRI